MSADSVLRIALGFIVVWGVVVALHSLWNAGDPRWDPIAPEEPAPHDHH